VGRGDRAETAHAAGRVAPSAQAPGAAPGAVCKPMHTAMHTDPRGSRGTFEEPRVLLSLRKRCGQ
jgi:hypothetical protein